MDQIKTKLRTAINELLKLRSSSRQCPGQIRDAEKEIIKLIHFQHYKFKEIKNKPKN